MEAKNEVTIIDYKLEALQMALKLLSSAEQFTLSVFDKDNSNHVVFCNKGEEVSVLKKSTSHQMYMIGDLENQEL